MKINELLRDYQNDAVRAAFRYINGNSANPTMMIMGTGAGKSWVIGGIASIYRGPILVLQPSKELLAQNHEKFVEMGGEAAIYSASLKKKELGHVTYATLGSIKKEIEYLASLDNLLLIVDECHFKVDPQATSEFMKFVKAVRPSRSIGLTATPFRLHNSMNGAQLKMLNRTRPKYYHNFCYVQQISEIIDLGFWTPSADENWEFDTGGLSYNSNGSNFTDASIMKANKINGVNNNICMRTYDLLRSGQRKSILIFADSVESGQAMCDWMNEKLFTGRRGAEMITGKTKGKDRDEHLRKFKIGELSVIINFGTLDKGFDAPIIDTIFLGRATNSLAQLYQMYGRGVRKFEGQLDFLFIDCCGNMDRLCHPRQIVIENNEYIGWAVFAGEKLVTGVPLGNAVPITREDLRLQAEGQFLDPKTLGTMPFGKYKDKAIWWICTHAGGTAMWYIENLDTDGQFGPALVNKFKAGMKAIALGQK